MKNYVLSALSVIVLASSCGINNTASTSLSDSVAAGQSSLPADKALYAMMQIRDTVRAGEPLELQFTVRNDADTTAKFLKWDTPYEALVSKYLDIRDENGNQVDYIGAMAKRMMPPPADSYIAVEPGDSLRVAVDLLKGYAVSRPSRYTVVYVGGNMSGLVVKDSVSFVYKP